MANPELHSKSSVKRWGGNISDYIEIHRLLDNVKSFGNNNAYRFMTHNTWFCMEIIPRIFGYNITNSEGKSIDTSDIAMLHVLEDFRMKFVPTPQDYINHMTVQPWMQNGVKLVDNQEAIDIAKEVLDRVRTNLQD